MRAPCSTPWKRAAGPFAGSPIWITRRPARCAKLDLMTKSAKQDTSNASAQAAETESAATTDAGAAEAKDDAKPDDKAEVKAKADAATEPAPDDAHEDDAKPDIDDVKAKFREALDRKRQVHAEGQGKGAHEAGKVNGAHGPAASRRSFRRKSG